MTKYLLLTAAVLSLSACCNCMDMKHGNGKMMMPAHNAALSCSTVKVSGMTCEACVGAVKANLKKINGVEDVAVDVKSGNVMIYTNNAAKIDSAAISKVLAKSDYKFVSMKPSCQ